MISFKGAHFPKDIMLMGIRNVVERDHGPPLAHGRQRAVPPAHGFHGRHPTRARAVSPWHACLP